MYTGSDNAQENLKECFTPKEREMVSVRTAQSLKHRAVSTISSRATSVTLMLGFTTVLWPHVERYCLEKELN